MAHIEGLNRARRKVLRPGDEIFMIYAFRPQEMPQYLVGQYRPDVPLSAVTPDSEGAIVQTARVRIEGIDLQSTKVSVVDTNIVGVDSPIGKPGTRFTLDSQYRGLLLPDGRGDKKLWRQLPKADKDRITTSPSEQVLFQRSA